MELSELTPTEQLVLVGMAKAIVHADREVSPEETAAIRALAAEMGTEVWNRRVADARNRLATAEQLFELARGVERMAARECIHAALRRLAEADAVDDSEQEILTWIAEVWQLGGAVSDEADDEDVEDDDTFDGEFVLFDPDEELED